ncbi:hypothetical protein [Amycolatopsis benzoatilytica]|uniref:hypothetical protein n=1 Tax=Amycolatopsis benzoatilytica TaxID=346045 RepID=UPI00036C38F5|nr:hypothetical protein [Amycolatopsis benzoatilytica]
MNPRTATVSEQLRVDPAIRAMRVLTGSYLALSVLTLGAIFLFRDNPSMVTDVVWVRATIVAASALLTFLFAARAARGSKRALLRLRIVSAVMTVAIIVIVSIPGFLPLWIRLEQGVCGLLLLAVVVLANGRHVRSLFA